MSSCGVKRIPTMSLSAASVPPLMPCDKKRKAFALRRINRWGPLSGRPTDYERCSLCQRRPTGCERC